MGGRRDGGSSTVLDKGSRIWDDNFLNTFKIFVYSKQYLMTKMPGLQNCRKHPVVKLLLEGHSQLNSYKLVIFSINETSSESF